MRDLTKGNVFKNFLIFTLPLIVTGILSQSFGMINSMMVGKILGENELAYIGSTASLIEVLNAVIWGYGTGAAIYVGRLFGSGDIKRMVNAIKTNMIVACGIALVLTVITLVFYKPIFSLLQVGEDIYHGSFVYYALSVIGLVVFTISWCSVYIFNAVGDSTFPFLMSLITSVLTVAGNAFVLMVLKTGVWGTAAVSIIAALIVDIFYIFKYIKLFKNVGAEKQKLVFNKHDILKAAALGIPCMIQQTVMYASSAGVQPVINALGKAAIAAYSICLRIYNLSAVVFQNISKCLSSYCAQSVGSGKISKITKGINACLILGFSVVVPLMALCFFFPVQISGWFFNDTASESALLVQRYILLCVPFFIFQILNNMFHNLYRGVMAANIAAFTTAFYTVVRIISTYLLTPVWAMDGVYAGFIIAWVLEVILNAVIFFTGKWKTKEIREIEAEEKHSYSRNANEIPV